MLQLTDEYLRMSGFGGYQLVGPGAGMVLSYVENA